MINKYKKEDFIALAKRKETVTWEDIQDYFGKDIINSNDFDDLLYELDRERVRVIAYTEKKIDLALEEAEKTETTAEEPALQKKDEENPSTNEVKNDLENIYNIFSNLEEEKRYNALVKLAEEKNNIISFQDIQNLIPLEVIYTNEDQFNVIIKRLLDANVQIEDIDFDLLGNIKFNYSYDESIFESYGNFENPRMIAIRKDMRKIAPDLERYNYVFLIYLINAYFEGKNSSSRKKYSRTEISQLYKNPEFDNRSDEELKDILYIGNEYKPIYSIKESDNKEFPENIKDEILNFFNTHEKTIKNITEIAATLKLYPSEVAFFVNQLEEQKIINEIEDVNKLMEEIKNELKEISADNQAIKISPIILNNHIERESVEKNLSSILYILLFEEKSYKTYIRNKLKSTILKLTVRELLGCITQSGLDAISPYIRILTLSQSNDYFDFDYWGTNCFYITKEVIANKNLTSPYVTIFDIFTSQINTRLYGLFELSDGILKTGTLDNFSSLYDLFDINDKDLKNSLKLTLRDCGLGLLSCREKTQLRRLYANYWIETSRMILVDIKQGISSYQNHAKLENGISKVYKENIRSVKITPFDGDLLSKINSINKPKIPEFENGTSKTIEDFWKDFIESRLPQNIDVVIKWHNLLKEYVKKPDAILGFRTGNVAGKLRRGWETITNDGYSFFYTDNGFPHFFYKLAYDGDYEPNLEEFYQLMKNKQFPIRDAFFMDSEEKHKAAFNVSGKNPGIGTSGYKLAHVIDAGRDYCVNGDVIGLAEICKKYFNLGQETDWTIDETTGLYSRKNFQIQEKDKKLARQLAEISFLRMVHPMNYFLTPKQKNTTTTNGVKTTKIYNEYSINGIIKYDIAEEQLLISYVRQKFHERYTVNGVDYFQDFLDLVYAKEDNLNEDGSTEINIVYSASELNQERKQDNYFEIAKELVDIAEKNNLTYGNNLQAFIDNELTKNNYSSKKKVSIGVQNSINENITDIETVNIKGHIFDLRKNPLKGDTKMQDHIYRTMRILLREGLIPEHELNLLLDSGYSKNTFGLGFPILSTVRIYSSGVARYTKDNFSGYYVCTQWAKNKTVMLEENFSQWLLHLEKITK